MIENPLLEVEFRIPFDRIEPQHVEPAVQQLLHNCQQQVDRLVAFTEPRSFANTMSVLDHATERLEYAMGIVRHLESVARIARAHGVAEISAVALQVYWSLYTGVLAYWAADKSPKQEDTLALLDNSFFMFSAWLQDAPAEPR